MSLINANKTTDYPIDQSQRRCTDLVCTCIGLTFTLLLIILALMLFNPVHQIQTSFPSDSQGKVCGFDLPKYPYIYFANFPKIDRRVCVSSCPTAKSTSLSCFPTASIGCTFNPLPAFYVGYYPSQPAKTPIGSYCEPINPTLRQNLYQDIGVANRLTFFSYINSIVISLLIALILSLVFMFVVQYLPRKMTYVAIFAGSLIIGVMALFIIFFPSSFLIARIIFFIVLALLLLSIYFGWKHERGTFKMYAQFMNFATEMISAEKRLMLYVPIFLGALVLFLLGVSYQLNSLWSSGGISFNKQFVFYQFQPGVTTIWTILVFVQAVWGLSFLKQSFNFVLSGNSVQWYFSRLDDQSTQIHMFQPLKILFTKHFGSVVAGSFMTGFFAVPDYIFDSLRPGTPPPSDSITSSCQRCINWVDEFFDLVRSDCMAYIYLTGNPYCNSARYCQYLCAKSSLTRNSQSISRFYRICAHFLLAGLASIINIILQGTNKSVFTVLVVFVLALFVSTFFVSLQADVSESIQVIFLMDEYFANRELNSQIKKEFNDSVIKKMKLHKDFAARIKEIYNSDPL